MRLSILFYINEQYIVSNWVLNFITWIFFKIINLKLSYKRCLHEPRKEKLGQISCINLNLGISIFEVRRRDTPQKLTTYFIDTWKVYKKRVRCGIILSLFLVMFSTGGVSDTKICRNSLTSSLDVFIDGIRDFKFASPFFNSLFFFLFFGWTAIY